MYIHIYTCVYTVRTPVRPQRGGRRLRDRPPKISLICCFLARNALWLPYWLTAPRQFDRGTRAGIYKYIYIYIYTNKHTNIQINM